MSEKITYSLYTLPIDMIYRILDQLDEETIILSIFNVCQRLNAIIDTYHRYQLRFNFVMNHLLQSLSHFINLHIHYKSKQIFIF